MEWTIHQIAMKTGIPKDTLRYYDKLVHRRINNESLRWSDFPRAQTKKPQRSPLRLRFFICTLEKPSSANKLIIYSSMY